MINFLLHRIARWLLSLLLVYGVYTETGLWTAFAVLLILALLEWTAYIVARWSWVFAEIEKRFLAPKETQKETDD